ncbi:unnamed protein product [Urochloa humidicola]
MPPLTSTFLGEPYRRRRRRRMAEAAAARTQQIVAAATARQPGRVTARARRQGRVTPRRGERRPGQAVARHDGCGSESRRCRPLVAARIQRRPRLRRLETPSGLV